MLIALLFCQLTLSLNACQVSESTSATTSTADQTPLSGTSDQSADTPITALTSADSVSTTLVGVTHPITLTTTTATAVDPTFETTTIAPESPETKAPTTEPPVTEPPVTEPPITEPPMTEPIDVTAPIVTGKNFEITQGDSVSYKNKIKVEDDYDDDPTIKVDNSDVDLDTPGTYKVIYTVTDQSGNSTVFTLKLTVKKKAISESEATEFVMSRAQSILNSITDASMSKLQIAYSIYHWTSKNITYIGTSDKSSWVIGAYDGFSTGKGDCFTYFATAKALLTVADIDHIDVYRAPNEVRSSRHYWLLVNVGDGWYHFDTNNSTFFSKRNANFFMVTDEEIWAWDNQYYRGEHTYDPTGMPEVSTVSIQDKIDYSSETLIG